MFENTIKEYLDANKNGEGFFDMVEEIRDFVAYFQYAWICMIAGCNKERRPPLFYISTWNKYDVILAELQIIWGCALYNYISNHETHSCHFLY
jgi:hypothetical protein